MIKVNKIKGLSDFIPPSAIITLTDIENHHEILYMSNPNNKIKIRKLDNKRYILIETGEIKYFNNTENRQQNINELRVTFKKLRDLINNNFTGHINEKCFTLTYKENMQDTKKLYKDYEKFVKKVRYKYGDFEYISIVEPQGRGAWHCHVLLKFKNNPGKIDNEILAKLWGHGFIKIKRVNNYMGEYITAYLADIEYNKENIEMLIEKGLDRSLQLKQIEIKGKTKRFIKGGRLYLYPTGINLFRKSKNIVYPEKPKGKYQDIKKNHKMGDINYRSQTEIINDDKLVNLIIHEQYR